MDLGVILICTAIYLIFGIIISMMYVREGLQDAAIQNTRSLYAKIFTRKNSDGKYVPSGYGMIVGTLFWIVLVIIFGIYNYFTNSHE